MITLSMSYFVFVGAALIKLRNHSNIKEKSLVVVITTLGAILWGSVIVQHPIDINKIIAVIIDHLR